MTVKENEKMKKPTVRSVTNSCSNQRADIPKKPSDSISQEISVDHSPIEARHQQPSDFTIKFYSTTALRTLPSPEPPSAQSESAHESPDLSKCLNIEI